MIQSGSYPKELTVKFGGQQVFTHGINFSVAHGQGQSLRVANDQMVASLLQNNRKMRQIGRSQGTNVGTRYWMKSEFTNVNEATGRTENIVLSATLLRNGDVLFISSVVPQNEVGTFQSAFANILNSVQWKLVWSRQLVPSSLKVRLIPLSRDELLGTRNSKLNRLPTPDS